MNRVFENVKNSKLISGPKFAFHSPYLDNSECVFSAVLLDRHTIELESDKNCVKTVNNCIQTANNSKKYH